MPHSLDASLFGSLRRSGRRGISLVELLTVIGVLGVFFGVALPAVQMARESARLAQCGSNLRNIGVALSNFQSLRKTFPAGSDGVNNTEHAWSSRILPMLESADIARQINYALPWNAPGANATAASQHVSVYICPSALSATAGKQDYGGIIGTGLLPLQAGIGPTDAFGCGILIVTSSQQPQPVRPAQITDGLSFTMLVGESADRADGQSGLWACGWNCYSQNEPRIDMDDAGSLHSSHPAGAQALFADGHVRLVIDEITAPVLGALCTRNGGELGVSSAFGN